MDFKKEIELTLLKAKKGSAIKLKKINEINALLSEILKELGTEDEIYTNLELIENPLFDNIWLIEIENYSINIFGKDILKDIESAEESSLKEMLQKQISERFKDQVKEDDENLLSDLNILAKPTQ